MSEQDIPAGSRPVLSHRRTLVEQLDWWADRLTEAGTCMPAGPERTTVFGAGLALCRLAVEVGFLEATLEA